MHGSRFALAIYLLFVFALALLLAPGPDAPTGQVAAIARVGPVPNLAGQWAGAWEDTIYFVQGSLTMDVAVDGNSYTATGTIDVSSINPGLGTLSGSASGTLAGDQLSFSFDCTDLGNGSGTLDGSDGTGSGTVTAPLSFGAFTFTGTASDTEIRGTFDFTSPTGGAGRSELTKAVPVEDEGWGELKSRFSGEGR